MLIPQSILREDVSRRDEEEDIVEIETIYSFRRITFPYRSLNRLFERILTRERTCGHPDRPYLLSINAYGRSFLLRPGTRCSRCATKRILQMHCRCPACGFIILPETGVRAISSEKKISDLSPRTAYLTSRHGGTMLIGCLRWDCPESIGDSGFWDGRVYQRSPGSDQWPTGLIPSSPSSRTETIH